MKLSNYRASINASTETLHIKDHGAGSKVFKSNERQVTEILKYNCSTEKDVQLLYRICNYLKVTSILELGTSLGIATHAMATARPLAQITTVEGSPEVQKFAKKELQKAQIKNVTCVLSTFSDFFSHKTYQNTYDLIYIDGHHDGAATLSYFDSILDQIHNDSVVIFDDIYWSKDMTQAWNKICKHSQVTASVDCFDLGMVFFRNEQSQQNFHIKL